MRQVSMDKDNHFVLMEAGEILDVSRRASMWMRHQVDIQGGNGIDSVAEFERCVVTGDESLVARSEKYLTEIEDQVPVSRGWRNLDDVVGAVPNIPAFLAGHPQCMRRRERVARDSAPLTIFMNLSSSMSISGEMILRRGLVLLALVRLLVEHRPVELWVGSVLGEGTQSSTAAWRIDTTPLDLARAAYQISSVSMSRLFGYAACEMLTNCHLGGFGRNRKEDSANLREVAGWHEVLALPAMYSSDPMVENPVGWLRDKMRSYLPVEEGA